jgi:hypothetical protein
MAEPTPEELQKILVAEAREQDAEQELRAKQFQKQVQEAFKRSGMTMEQIAAKLRPPEHPSLGWLLWFGKRYNFNASALPYKRLPNMIYGDKGVKHPSYVPIEKRTLFALGVQELCQRFIDSYMKLPFKGTR